MNIGLMAADLSLGRSRATDHTPISTKFVNDVEEDEGDDQQSMVITQKVPNSDQQTSSEIMNLESTTANSSTVAGHGSSADTDLVLVHGGLSAGLINQPLPDLHDLEVYHKALEEERNKIQAFERELPFCMKLLDDAIEASRERLEDRLSCKLNTASTATVSKTHHSHILHKLNFMTNSTPTTAQLIRDRDNPDTVDVSGSNPAKRKWPSPPATPASTPAKLAPAPNSDVDDPADLHLHIYQRPPKWPNPNFPVDHHLPAQQAAMKAQGSIKLQEFVKKSEQGMINDEALMLGERLGSVINANYSINHQDVKPNILSHSTDHQHRYNHLQQHHQTVLSPNSAINARINNHIGSSINSRSAHNIIDLEKDHQQQHHQYNNYNTALMVAENAAAFNARVAINANTNNKNNGNGNTINALQSSPCSAFSRPTINISSQFCKEIGAMPTCTLSPLSSSKTCSSSGGGGGGGGGGCGPPTPLVQSVQRKPRRCWSPELHQRFLNALNHLGGCQVATPKQIREFMNVEGLTNDEVKSHLQKFRLHMRRPNNVATTGQVESPPTQPGGPNGHHLVVFGHIWVPPSSDATNDQHTPRSVNTTTTTITRSNEQSSTAIELCAKSFNHVATSNTLTSNNVVHHPSSPITSSTTRATNPLIRLCQPNYNNSTTTSSLHIQPLDDTTSSPSRSSPPTGVHLQLLHTNNTQTHDRSHHLDSTHSSSNHDNFHVDANRPHSSDTSIDLTIACNNNHDIPIHHHENITNNATHIREASACS